MDMLALYEQEPKSAFVKTAESPIEYGVELSQTTLDLARDTRLAWSPQSGGKMSANDSKLEDYGSIQMMSLPDEFIRNTEPSDAGYLNLGDDDPRVFNSKLNDSTKIGAWHSNFPSSLNSGLHDVLQKPPHNLSDDEYFKISGLMSPGPWSGDGRNHELSMKSQEINGKKAIVYDYWKSKDPSHDSFDSKPGVDDIRGRVVFFPNEKTNKVDILWLQAPISDFEKKATDFDQSLKQIKWR